MNRDKTSRTESREESAQLAGYCLAIGAFIVLVAFILDRIGSYLAYAP